MSRCLSARRQPASILLLTLAGVIKAAQCKVDADPCVHACGVAAATREERHVRRRKGRLAGLESLLPLTFLFPRDDLGVRA